MSDTSFDINKLIAESKETLLNPKSYFSSMSLSGGFAEPVIKAAIYGTVAGIFLMIWSFLGWSAAGGMSFLGGAVGIMALISTIIASIIGVFIGGALMLVVSAICGGQTDFEANLRVAASLMALYPVSALLACLNGISFFLGSLVSLIVSLYGIYLLYTAVIQALKGKESAAKIVLLVLILLTMLGFFVGQRGARMIDTYEPFNMEQLD